MDSAGFYNCLKLENIVEIHGRHTRVDEKSLEKKKISLHSCPFLNMLESNECGSVARLDFTVVHVSV